MLRHHNVLLASGAVMLGVSLVCMTSAFAAKAVDLKHQPFIALQSFVSSSATDLTNLKQTSFNVDFNHTAHVRVQETYAGHSVWGGDAVVHIPNSGKTSLQNVMAQAKSIKATMNGVLYQDLNKDLQNTPAFVLSAAQAKKAHDHAVSLYQKKSGNKEKIITPETKLVVFVDKSNKAHWAYYDTFLIKPAKGMPVKPTCLIDAKTFAVLQEWNDIKTLDDVAVGGGFGGNDKMGQLIYDGLTGNLPQLNIKRDAETNICYLQNADVIVKDVRDGYHVYKYDCAEANADHNNVFWNGDNDAINGAYSPADDALFTGAVIKDMYMKWYGLPVLVENGEPMVLTMNVHYDIENAFWDGHSMTFGDGGRTFYPLVSLGVAAHEVSHGFTEQHSNLAYYAQSGGLNEAFSDMAAQAGEFYAYGHNSWQIGPEIFKAKDEALRYMDDPTKDCGPGQKPGDWCSIGNVKDYNDWLDVHYSSGVFNKAFYLLGTTKDWDTKKAFNVMVHANQNYWTSNTSFTDAACGVLKAAADYQYDATAVQEAMAGVGIDTSGC